MAKQAKYGDDLDRISSLPDSILCHIMSFLPIEDAVRTSILSTRWKYLFASMSNLDFRYSCVALKNVENFKNFNNFVDRLFFFSKQLSLECFRIDYFLEDDDVLRFYGWICAALWRGVKEIYICLESRSEPVLPTFLFTSQSLVKLTLKLDIAGNTNVPTNVCLPNLKTLYLQDIIFSDGDSIHRLISGCLVLEELVMELSMLPKMCKLNIQNLSLKRLVIDFEVMLNRGQDFNHVIMINAPNLVHFNYIDKIAKGYTVANMSSLVKADVRIYQFVDEATYDVNRERAAIDLLQGICNVQSLSLAIKQAETVIPMHREPVLVFPNLVELEIRNEYEDWQGTWLVEFLHCVPNLRTLHLLYLVIDEEGFGSLPEKVPSCLLFDLKEIKISRFKGDKHMFEFINYFLHNAVVLEKLIIGMEFLNKKEQLRITEKLLRLPKNSKNCQVVT